MIAGDGKNRSFALKQMKKSQIVETRQQQHIMSGMDNLKQDSVVTGIEIQGGIHRPVMDHDVHDFASSQMHKISFFPF